jgi:hypothetical protein
MAASEVGSRERASICWRLGVEEGKGTADALVAVDSSATEGGEGEGEEAVAAATDKGDGEPSPPSLPKPPPPRSILPSLSLSGQLRPSQALWRVISIGLSPRTIVAPTWRAAGFWEFFFCGWGCMK